MELTNDFTVPVPVEQAWEVLTDIERIAPCMPGAQLQEVEGDEYRGIVKVKVGPITAQYKGAATFVERDDAGHRAVLRAEGRDTRGQGNASATITATLEEAGDGTQVRVHTDLTVTGKVAQFGRGVLADVSAKLLRQFVECLESDVLGGGATTEATTEAPAAPSAATTVAAAPASAPDGPTGNGASRSPAAVGATTPPPGGTAATAPAPEASGAAAGPAVRRIDSPEAKPVDLLDSAGAPVAKRLLPVIVAVVVVLLLLRRRRRRR